MFCPCGLFHFEDFVLRFRGDRSYFIDRGDSRAFHRFFGVTVVPKTFPSVGRVGLPGFALEVLVPNVPLRANFGDVRGVCALRLLCDCVF